MTDLYEYIAFLGSDLWKEVAGPNGDRIVLLGWEKQGPEFRNLLRVDKSDRVVWTVQPPRLGAGIYIEARFNEGALEAFNKEGYLDKIDYQVGTAMPAEQPLLRQGKSLTELEKYVASIGSKIDGTISGLEGDKIVLLAYEGQPNKFCNLLRVDSQGRVIWRVKPPHPLEGVYGWAEIKDGKLEAYNTRGFIDAIDYETGKATQILFTK